MSITPLADQVAASATQIEAAALTGASPAQLLAHAHLLIRLAVQVRRLERAWDEIVADAMQDEQRTHQHQRHQRIIEGLLAGPSCHLAQRRPGGGHG